MIPNYQPSLRCEDKAGGYICTGAWNDSSVFAVGNGTDGALDECGFTGCSSGLVLGPAWENKIRFVIRTKFSESLACFCVLRIVRAGRC